MNDEFEMNGFDSDPADCNGYKSGAHYNTESADEFSPVPSEFGSEDKTVNTTTEKDVFTGDGIIAPLGMKNEGRTDLGSLYDTESAKDNGCGCGCGDGCDNDGCHIDYDDDCGGHCNNETHRFRPSPEDETAATCDDCYNNSTVSAREKCELDDYEIISDVLSNEKQLVKLYSTALCESAEEPLRNVIRENLIECAQDQYATFEFMSKRGQYPQEQAPEEKIAQAKDQFRPLTNGFGNND